MKVPPQPPATKPRDLGLPAEDLAPAATEVAGERTSSPPPGAPVDSLERAPEQGLFARHAGAIPTEGTVESPHDKIQRLRSTAAELRSLAEQTLPSGLGPGEVAAEQDYSRWLAGSADTLEKLAEGWQQAVAPADLVAAHHLQETQMSFNLQYLQLQSQMQHENRAYTALSNIMKTKHESAKNAIDNIR